MYLCCARVTAASTQGPGYLSPMLVLILRRRETPFVGHYLGKESEAAGSSTVKQSTTERLSLSMNDSRAIEIVPLKSLGLSPSARTQVSQQLPGQEKSDDQNSHGELHRYVESTRKPAPSKA